MDVMAINPSCGQMKGRTYSEVHGAHLVEIFGCSSFGYGRFSESKSSLSM